MQRNIICAYYPVIITDCATIARVMHYFLNVFDTNTWEPLNRINYYIFSMPLHLIILSKKLLYTTTFNPFFFAISIICLVPALFPSHIAISASVSAFAI